MIGKLLEAGSMFDWISPTLSIAQDLAHGGGHTFLIPQDAGFSGREVAKLLGDSGIQSWGHMIVNGTIMITVKPADAAQASEVLDGAGVPASGPPIPLQAKPAPRTKPGQVRGRSRLWRLLE